MRLIITTLCAFIAMLAGLPAQSTGVSETVGIVTLQAAPAVSSSVPSSTSLCFPFYAAPSGTGQIVGKVTAVSSNTISNANAGWSTNAFAQTGNPYFVRFLTGTAEGRTLRIASNTATQLTVDNQGIDLNTLGIATGQNGDRYEVFRGFTLWSLFGNTTFGGPNSDVADTINIWNGSVWEYYFFDNVDNRWERKGFNFSANNVVLRPDVAVLFVRRATTPYNLTLIGRAPSTDLRYLIKDSGSTYISTGFPAAVSLATHAFNTIPGWVSNPDHTQADQVAFWTGASWQRFFFDSGDNRWEMVGFNFNANNAMMPLGRPGMIQRTMSFGTTWSTFVHQLPYVP
jgi:hypothetical protein